MMWQILATVTVWILASSVGVRAANGAVVYYVQLVRGNDSDRPPQAGTPRVEAQLAGIFNQAFKWKSYWAICQRAVELSPGQTTHVALSNGWEVEVDLASRGKQVVTATNHGRIRERTVQPEGAAAIVIGGNLAPNGAWFIVVRRRKPGS